MPNIPLHHSDALIRDQLLKEGSVKYELFMMLSKKDTFEGKVNIEFYMTDKNIGDLFLDFQGAAISELTVNGIVIPDQAVRFTQHKVYLPKYNLQSESVNSISLKFENTYVSNSSGFHRYKDPVDGETYTYTHLEPFNCNRWFPCFDQPSIRAPMAMRVVTSEPSWTAISNENILKTYSVG